MTSDWPVINEAPSEHNHITAEATSSGFPMRPTGCAATIASLISGLLVATSINAVWMKPGHTALMRRPCLAYSSAAAFVRPMIACLLAT